MNIHFLQVERKPHLSSYILAVFAVFTVMMFALSLIRHAELHWSVSAISLQAAQTENSNLPVALPAPLPPAEQVQPVATPEPIGNSSSILVPQIIPAPVPSVP